MLIGALYHPTQPKYKNSAFCNFIAANVATIRQQFPTALVVLAGHFNRLSCKRISSKIEKQCSLQQIVPQMSCGPRILDIIYVSEACYSNIDFVKPITKTDHKAVVAHLGVPVHRPR